MKSTMDRVPAWLALMAAAILTFTFTACSDDEDIENEVTYTYVFTEISASHPDFLEEKGKIENAFKSALGATGSNFTKRGTVEECDKQVYAACEEPPKMFSLSALNTAMHTTSSVRVFVTSKR